MASTSVHFSPQLLERLDEIASKREISRNRLIVEACEKLLDQDLGDWPSDFFANDYLSPEELEELQDDAPEMEAAILAARRNRAKSPL